MNRTLPSRLPLIHTAVDSRRTLLGTSLLVICASAFVAICAHVSVPLGFTPVPTTLANFAVVLVGLALGPVAGFSALALYLVEGYMGLPVFSPHGLGGAAQLMGPTGGYLFAYPLSAAIAGASVRLLRGVLPTFVAALAASTLATIPVFLLGAGWLAHAHRLSPAQALTLAVTPFLAGEAFKILSASAIYTAARTLKRS